VSIRKLGENIETMSEGRIKVQVLYSGEGVGTTGILGAVKSGLITMARLSNLCTLVSFLQVS